MLRAPLVLCNNMHMLSKEGVALCKLEVAKGRVMRRREEANQQWAVGYFPRFSLIDSYQKVKQNIFEIKVNLCKEEIMVDEEQKVNAGPTAKVATSNFKLISSILEQIDPIFANQSLTKYKFLSISTCPF